VGLSLSSGTFPLTTPLNLAQHDLDKAISLSRCTDRGADLTVAVTGGAGLNVLVANSERKLSYRMPAPTTGFHRSSAITADGRKIAIATDREDVLVVDVGVFASRPTGTSSDQSDYDPESEEPAIY
jgi:hypothetical protein